MNCPPCKGTGWTQEEIEPGFGRVDRVCRLCEGRGRIDLEDLIARLEHAEDQLEIERTHRRQSEILNRNPVHPFRRSASIPPARVTEPASVQHQPEPHRG